MKAAIVKVPGMKKKFDGDGVQIPPSPSHGHQIDEFINKIASFLGSGNPMKHNLYRQFVISRQHKPLRLLHIFPVRC